MLRCLKLQLETFNLFLSFYVWFKVQNYQCPSSFLLFTWILSWWVLLVLSPFFFVVDTPCHPFSMPQTPCHACEAFFFDVFNIHGAFLYLLLHFFLALQKSYGVLCIMPTPKFYLFLLAFPTSLVSFVYFLITFNAQF
jgi:hypothetical protein